MPRPFFTRRWRILHSSITGSSFWNDSEAPALMDLWPETGFVSEPVSISTRLRQDAPCGSAGRNGDWRPRRSPQGEAGWLRRSSAWLCHRCPARKRGELHCCGSGNRHALGRRLRYGQRNSTIPLAQISRSTRAKGNNIQSLTQFWKNEPSWIFSIRSDRR